MRKPVNTRANVVNWPHLAPKIHIANYELARTYQPKRAITTSFAAQNRSMARSNPSKSLYGSAAASAYRGPLRAILPEQEQGQTTQRNTSEYSVFYVLLLHTFASSSKLQGKYPIFVGD